MTQLEELLQAAAESDAPLGVALDALRSATVVVTEVVTRAASLQGEAHDAEFEDLPARTRAHLEGRLLQRTRFVQDRAADLVNRIRDLAQGIRDLRADCAELEATTHEPVAPGTGTP